jgi:hypothetical protein
MAGEQERVMKIWVGIFLILSLLFCGSLFAQTDLTGTWQGKLAIDPKTTMAIQFILTRQADGSYKAVVNSPESGAIKNVPASAVKFAGGKLTIDVASLSGSYAGTVGKGTITGEWKQPGSTLPLVLTPYKKPAAGSFKPLLGEWSGKLTVPGITSLAIIFRFEMAKDGNLAAFMDVPDQNAKGLIASDVKLDSDLVSLKIPTAGIEYNGQLSGNNIKGTFKQSGASFELNLAKGKYVIPGIDMAAEDMNKLLGQWAGRMKMGPDANADMATVIFRFEKTKDGKMSVFSDSPEQGSYGRALTDVTLKGDELIIKFPGTSGGYTGKLSGNSIAGTFAIAGMKLDLTVTKGAKFSPPVTQIDLPADVMKKLLGRWSGNLGTLAPVFRFERNSAGESAIFLDIPQQNIKSAPILKASLVDGSLVLKIVGAEYTGKLEGNKINGALKAQGQSIPLPLTKE